MESIEAVDPRTFVMHWSQPFPDAASFRQGWFEPVPRHILEEPLSQFLRDPVANQDAFRTNHLVVRFMADENTVLSNLLGESIDLATDYTLRYEQAKVLRGE